MACISVTDMSRAVATTDGKSLSVQRIGATEAVEATLPVSTTRSAQTHTVNNNDANPNLHKSPSHSLPHRRSSHYATTHIPPTLSLPAVVMAVQLTP